MPSQPISGLSVDSEGDIIALCSQNLATISILRLSHGTELYRIDPQLFQLTSLVGLSFAPGSGSTLMTAHSGHYALYWDIERLAEGPSIATSLNINVSRKPEQCCITTDGDMILLNGATEKHLRPLILHLDKYSKVQVTPIKPPLFDRHQDKSSPMAISEDGHSAVIGQYLYQFSPKIKIKRLQIPKSSKIVRTAIKLDSTVAFAIISQNIEVQLRVYNWSLKKSGFHDWIPPSGVVLNIWGLAFAEERFLAVGVQLRSVGLDKFAVYLLVKLKGGSLRQVAQTPEWEAVKPMKMAFRKDGNLVVLANDPHSIHKPPCYSLFVFDIPPNALPGFRITSVTWKFEASQIPPSMTSDGEVFYLGLEKNEGWIMRLDSEAIQRRDLGKRITWCPSSWRSVGSLSILCTSMGDMAIIICLNKVLGIVAIKTS